MAITLAEQHVLATNGEFINRIRQAGATVALEIMSEEPALLPGGNAEYEQRANLARRFLNDAPAAAQRAAYVLATASGESDPILISDTIYLNFVRTNWSALAGYNPLYVPDVPV